MGILHLTLWIWAPLPSSHWPSEAKCHFIKDGCWVASFFREGSCCKSPILTNTGAPANAFDGFWMGLFILLYPPEVNYLDSLQDYGVDKYGYCCCHAFCLNNRRSTFYAFYSPNQIAQPMVIVYETTRQDYTSILALSRVITGYLLPYGHNLITRLITWFCPTLQQRFVHIVYDISKSGFSWNMHPLSHEPHESALRLQKWCASKCAAFSWYFKG